MHFIESFLVLVVASLAAAWSPNNRYGPANVSCPSDITLVREANGLSQNETNWLQKRRPIVKEALHSFVNRTTRNFNGADQLVRRVFASNQSNPPVVAIGASGGGFRSMLSGAGMIAAFDNRSRGAVQHGLGGLLQGTTYLAGLSGGNWLTGTLAWNNWTSVQAIADNITQDDGKDKYVMWSIGNNIFDGTGNLFRDHKHWERIAAAIDDKAEHFNVTLNDVFSRTLSYYFFPRLYRGGVGFTWSTLREADVFRDAQMPFPITVADGWFPNTTLVNSNSTIFEFNPFEMGSWDPSLRAFADVKYLGTEISNNRPRNNGTCVAGYDNTGFIMGASSTLFSQFLHHLNNTNFNDAIKNVVHRVERHVQPGYEDIAIFRPNPFHNSNYLEQNYTRGLVDSDTLLMADGGEDQENIPFTPLLQRDRNVDIIFAFDNSADTEEDSPDGANWPLGTSLVNTYKRQFSPMGWGNISFPHVPDEQTFYSEGLHTRPTFFGCDRQNLTDLSSIPPLVVYMPNAHYSAYTNTSTFEMTYTRDERLALLQNGFEAATRGNLTYDKNFAGCIACAVMRRSQERLNATWPDDCRKCFSQYCWDGQIRHNGTQVTATNDYARPALFTNGASSIFSSRALLSLFVAITSFGGLF